MSMVDPSDGMKSFQKELRRGSPMPIFGKRLSWQTKVGSILTSEEESSSNASPAPGKGSPAGHDRSFSSERTIGPFMFTVLRKKTLANIRPNELEAFRELAQVVLGYTPAEIAKRVEDGALFNVEKPEENNG